MSSDIAILRLDGAASGTSYRFRGARTTQVWPVSLAELSAGGVWNFFMRMGWPVNEPFTSATAVPRSCRLIVVCVSNDVDPRAHLDALRSRSPGCSMILTGDVSSLRHLVDVAPLQVDWTNGVAADLGGRSPLLWALDDTHLFEQLRPTTGWRSIGSLYRVGGNRQDPGTALIAPLPSAPLALANDGLVVLNGNPFAVYQGLLQGALDLSAWINWYPRLWWLDEYCRTLRSAIDLVAPGATTVARTLPRPSLNVVLRHDLDWSADTDFFQYETDAGIPATYAVLDDDNTGFWTRTLAGNGLFENALHYDSGRRPGVAAKVRARLTGRGVPIRPDVRRVAAGGLARQLKRARRLGIGSATLHRHLRYLYYPEWIDALDDATERFGVIGGSSYFRGRVIRYSADGSLETTHDVSPPDVLSPNWMPFRLWHAGAARLSRAWESASLMDPDPSVAVSVLDTCRSSGLPATVTICYHPAHTSTQTLMPAGTMSAFEELIDHARSSGWEFTTLEQVYRDLNAALPD